MKKLPTSRLFDTLSIKRAAAHLTDTSTGTLRATLLAYQRLNPKRLARGSMVVRLKDDGLCCCSVGAVKLHLAVKAPVPQDKLSEVYDVLKDSGSGLTTLGSLMVANDSLMGPWHEINTVATATERYRVMYALVERELKVRGEIAA